MLLRENYEPLTGVLSTALPFSLILYLGVLRKISFGEKHPYPQRKVYNIRGFLRTYSLILESK